MDNTLVYYPCRSWYSCPQSALPSLLLPNSHSVRQHTSMEQREFSSSVWTTGNNMHGENGCFSRNAGEQHLERWRQMCFFPHSLNYYCDKPNLNSLKYLYISLVKERGIKQIIFQKISNPLCLYPSNGLCQSLGWFVSNAIRWHEFRRLKFGVSCPG